MPSPTGMCGGRGGKGLGGGFKTVGRAPDKGRDKPSLCFIFLENRSCEEQHKTLSNQDLALAAL